MADTTDVLALPFPEGADANDVPADMQALAERLDEVPGIESLTSAEIAALSSAQKPAGRVVYNSTTSKLQVSNGTSFADVDAAALLKAGGTMTGGLTMSGATIAMGGQKITGLAAATANGDAVRYEQALLLPGGTMTGDIAMGSNKVTGLGKGTATGDAMARQQVQSGTTSAISANGTTTISFSPAFGATPVVVIAPTGDVESTGSWWVNTVSTTGATVHYQNSTGPATMAFTWIAVGN